MYIYINLEEDWSKINFRKYFEHTTLLKIKTMTF